MGRVSYAMDLIAVLRNDLLTCFVDLLHRLVVFFRLSYFAMFICFDPFSMFFDGSDGIFLNYTWNEKKLEKSVENSGDRIRDVFVGVDVFGRNCFGGGGWNTWKVSLVCV